MKGQKTCDKCHHPTGPRTKTCKKCGRHFVFQPKGRNKIRTNELKDWRSLKRGQIVKSIQGHGPYWINDKGERESMGYFGLFKVSGVSADGVGAYPHGTKQKDGGYHFLYMGQTKENSWNIRWFDNAHKLELVKCQSA